MIDWIVLTIIMGMALWAMAQYVPMPAMFKQTVIIGVSALYLLWMLRSGFGVLGGHAGPVLPR